MSHKPLPRLRSLLLLALACCLFSSGPANSQQGGTAHYLYDENGRLKAVLLSNGEASIYNYDAAGNLLSITRQLSTVLSIIDFAPKSGSIGTSVTIYGTGFSPTANENTVSFNGTPATVITSTVSEIVTVVPAGATTGFVSVTSPIGSTASTTPFAILTPPTITGFTPAAGSVGAAVTISGTNFEILPGRTDVRFNGELATTTFVTDTSVVAQVPTASSGRITVTTSAGTATSNDDFFISPDDGLNVTVTARLAFGQPKPFTLSSAGQAALFVFDGTAGQNVSLNLFNSSFTLDAVVSVYAPDGSQLVFPTSTDRDYRGVFIEPFTLPETGTYSILVDTAGYPNSFGSATLQIYNVPPDTTGTIQIDGEATIANLVPGQNARLTFTSNGNQRVRVTGVISELQKSGFLSVFGPDGSALGVPQFMTQTLSGQQVADFGSLRLTTSGTYTIIVDPRRADITSATVALTELPPDIAMTIAAGDPAVTVSTGVGQNASLTFAGTAGERISLNIFNASNFGADVSIIGPNGESIAPRTPIDFGYRGIFFEPRTLPLDGTYTILIDTSTYFTNSSISVSVQLFDVPDDAQGTLVFGGQADISNTVPGQNARLTFEGTAGEVANITGNVAPNGQAEAGAYLYVFNPDGSLLAGPRFMSQTVFGQQPAFFGNLVLPSDGAYSLFIDPTSSDLLTATVSVAGPPPDVVTTIVPNGEPVIVTMTSGQNARLNFDGTAGQRVSLEFGNVFITVSKVSILNTTNGTMVYDFIYSGGSVRFIDTITLPDTGAYAVYVDPLENYAGSMTLTLYDVPPDIAESLTIGGPPLPLSLTPGQNAVITFEGVADQHVSLNITDANIPFSYVYVYRPDGLAETSGVIGFGGQLFSNINLSTTGTYRIVIDPYGSYSGNLTLSLYETNQPEILATITPGVPLELNFPQAEQNARVSFEATAGQKFILDFTNITVSSSRVTLLAPNGSFVSGPTVINYPGRPVAFEDLPVSGTYKILVDPQSASVGSMTLTLTEVLDLNSSFVVNGPPVTITTTSIQNARLTFNGTAGHRLFLTFSDLTMSPNLSILNPDDSVLTSDIQMGGNLSGLDVQNLPTTGVYTLVIDANEFESGTVTIQATESGSLNFNGAPVTTVVTSSQETAPLTFSGLAGNRIHLFAFNSTIPSGTISIRGPNGTVLTSSPLTSIFNLILPDTGTYSVTIIPDSGNTGRITLSVSPAGGGSGSTD
jgi:YD repeat-containing protein